MAFATDAVNRCWSLFEQFVWICLTFKRIAKLIYVIYCWFHLNSFLRMLRRDYWNKSMFGRNSTVDNCNSKSNFRAISSFCVPSANASAQPAPLPHHGEDKNKTNATLCFLFRAIIKIYVCNLVCLGDWYLCKWVCNSITIVFVFVACNFCTSCLQKMRAVAWVFS